MDHKTLTFIKCRVDRKTDISACQVWSRYRALTERHFKLHKTMSDIWNTIRNTMDIMA